MVLIVEEHRMVIIFWTHTPIFSKYMFFWCLFLELYQTAYHSNVAGLNHQVVHASWSNLYIWLVSRSARINEQTSQRHMFDRHPTTSSSIVNYSTLNNEHNWKGMCTQIRPQQTCTFSNHNYIEDLILHPRFTICFIVDLLNAIQVLLCKTNW